MDGQGGSGSSSTSPLVRETAETLESLHIADEAISEAALLASLQVGELGDAKLRSLVSRLLNELLPSLQSLSDDSAAPKILEAVSRLLSDRGDEAVLKSLGISAEAKLGFEEQLYLLDFLVTEVVVQRMMQSKQVEGDGLAGLMETRSPTQGADEEAYADLPPTGEESSSENLAAESSLRTICLALDSKRLRSISSGSMTGVQLLKAADEAVQKREAAKPESEKDQPLIDIRKLSSEQMEKLNTINQDLQKEYATRRKMAVDRLWATLPSLLTSPKLDKLMKQTIRMFFRQQLGQFLRSNPCQASVLDVAAARSDLLAQFCEKTSPQSAHNDVAKKAILQMAVESRKSAGVSKTKKKNMKAREKRRKRQMGPGEGRGSGGGGGDGDDDEIDVEEAEEDYGDDVEANLKAVAARREKDEESGKKKKAAAAGNARREEGEAVVKAQLEKKKEEEPKQLSKKERLFLKQQAQKEKRKARQAKKLEKVKNANQVQKGTGGEKDEGEEEEEEEEEAESHDQQDD